MKKQKQKIKKISAQVFVSALSVFSFVHLAKAEMPKCGEKSSTILCNPLKAESFTLLMENISLLAVEIGIPIDALFIIYSGLKLVMAKIGRASCRERV